MGRSVAALLVMVVAFVALAALFIGLDGAAGVHPPSPLFAAGVRQSASTATPPTIAATPHGTPTGTGRILTGATSTIPPRSTTATPGPNGGPTATAPAVSPTPASVTATDTAPAASVTPPATMTGTLTPTTIGTVTATGTVSVTGDTPPHYGALLNYPNNTQFTPALMQSLAEQTIALTNAQRAAHGLPTLSESGQLDIIAASRSQDQIQRRYCGHYDPTGPVGANGQHAAAVQELLTRDGVSYTEVGENLICRAGYALNTATPRALVDSWMQHPEHRDNILHAGYTMIGVGMATEDEPDGLHVIVAQVFVH